MTLEKFATDFINSLQSNKANSFKEKYRKYDLLIIDDIQFIGKMEKIQEELFHTFNTFYENNKQIYTYQIVENKKRIGLFIVLNKVFDDLGVAMNHPFYKKLEFVVLVYTGI
jgi:nucleoside-triphosphatase THEP1